MTAATQVYLRERDRGFVVEPSPGACQGVVMRRGRSNYGCLQAPFASETEPLDSARFVTAGAYALLAKLRNTEEEA